MPKFADFQSMIDDEPPTADELKERVTKFNEPLQTLYLRSRYDQFFNAKYPHGSAIQNPQEHWTFDFDTRMTKAEEEELQSLCWNYATDFVIDLLVGIENLVDKDEGALDAIANDLQQVAASFDGAMTDAKLQHVQDRFESWHGDAGTAIREGYSNHFTRATQMQAAMANGLANAARLDSLIVMKLRHHLDGLLRDVATAIDNGPAASDIGLKQIIDWLTVIGVIAGVPGGPAVMGTVRWVGSSLKTILSEMPLEPKQGPTMDSSDPDELKAQALAALEQVAEVVRADREKLAGELVTAFEEPAALLASGDPAQSSRVVPNPNGVGGIAL